MTYDAQETSVESGEPIALFEFAVGDETTRFTSAAEDWTDGNSPANTYTAESISITNIRSSSNFAKEDVTVRIADTNTFAQSLFNRTSSTVQLTIKSAHLTDASKETKVKWIGYFVEPKYKLPWIELTFRSFMAQTEKLGRVPRSQRLCNWSVYSPGCDLDVANFQTEYPVLSQSGLTYTVSGIVGQSPALDANYYLNGIIEYGGERRRIVGFSKGSETVTLQEDIAALSAAVGGSPAPVVKLAPGCARTRYACSTRFDNLLHHLSFPEMPTSDRLSGTKRADLK